MIYSNVQVPKSIEKSQQSQLHLANVSISIVNTKFVAFESYRQSKGTYATCVNVKHTEKFSSVFGGHSIVKNIITCREEERSYTYSFKSGRDLMPNDPSLRMTLFLKEQSLRIRSLPLKMFRCMLRFYDNVAATTRYFLECQEPLVCFPR